jgi:uronate dehydrogenase
MRVLLTGAAGYIGGLVIAKLADRYDWVLTDRKPIADTRGLTFVQADISEIDQLRPLCQNVDTVLHLAAVAQDSAWQDLLPNNVVGVYNLFQAASEAGCKRVVFASSIQAVEGYPRDVQIRDDMPVSPLTLYGATKAWGEALAAFYARQKNLSAICLRIGWVMPRHHRYMAPGAPRLDMILTHPDLIRLVVASIDAPDDLRFGIFHGVSNNRWKRLDITGARELLKYEPQDDAFALANRNYPAIAHRWGGRVKRALRSVVSGK